MSTAHEAIARVAEYVRQRDIAMESGNVGDVIATIYTDPDAKFADLNVQDLRLILDASGATRALHRSADPDGRGSICTHCTSVADCDVRWPCRTVRTLDGV